MKSKVPKCVRTRGKDPLCLNERQEATLDIKSDRPIACGGAACVYESNDPARVVKVTRDSSDVAALKQGQGVPGVVRLHASYRLRDPMGKLYAHAAIVDRLGEAPLRWGDWIDALRMRFMGSSPQAASEACKVPGRAEDRTACLALEKTLRGLIRKGVDPVFDLSVNNVGVDATGRPVIYDLGVYKETSVESELLGSKKKLKVKARKPKGRR